MHPLAQLLIWLLALLVIQWADWPALLLITLLALLAGSGAWRRCLVYLRRSRMLLLVLWLVIAYGVPGEALGEFGWMPTYEGAVEASRHALRLLVMLATLAVLFEHLGHRGLLVALSALLLPMKRLGVNSERLIVRLALALEVLEQAPVHRDWRSMLSSVPQKDEPGVLRLSLPEWQQKDFWGLLLAVLVLFGIGLI